jgi:hypothetical protein
MKSRKSLIDEIHALEQKIFKEFALETSNNIHVEAVDLKNPLTSIIKILVSDLISSQLYAQNAMPKIIPKQILVKDEQNRKYSHFHFTNKGVNYLKSQFYEAKKQTTDDGVTAVFDKFRSEILNINKESNIVAWQSILYVNLSEGTFSNEYFTYCSLKDADITTTLSLPNHHVNFNNTDSKLYKDIRPDEKINYSIYFDYEISDNSSEFDNEKTKIFVTKIAALALHTKRNRQNFSEIENQATRAAISQVLARNTSHNIGAHVMNKLIGDLSQVNFDSFKNYESEIKLYTDLSDSNKKLLDQISIFNNYVKCRMDYLADISFGTPLMQTNKYAYGELFTELDKVRLLLENISGLDKWKFEIKFTRNGKPLKSDNDDLLVAIPNDILGTQAFYNILENIIRNTAKHAQKKTVKDEKGEDKTPKTVFTVNFIDSVVVDNKKVVDYCECEKADCSKAHRKEIENTLNEFIAVEVYDDIPVEGNPKELSEIELNEYKRMMGDKKPDFKGYVDYLVFSQNSKLNEDILSENSTLRSYSLGLVEMDASAAYLRKRPVEYINHRSYDIQYDESWSRNTEKNEKDKNGLRGTNCRHFLKAFKKTEGDKNYLGYRFFLHRPAVVLVVTELLKDDKLKKDKLKKEGIWIVTKEEFEKDLKGGKVFPHEFVIHTELKDCVTKIKIKDVETEINLLEYFKTSLPIRILEVNNGGLNTILKTDAENIVCKCWSRWFDKLRDKNQCINHSNDHGELFYSIKGTYNKYACHSLVLIDHLYKEDGTQDIEKAKEIWCDLEDEKCHAEALSSLAQSKLPDYNKIVNQTCRNEKVGKKLLKCYLNNLPIDTKEQIVESAFAKVVVIDERIQEAAHSRDFMTIKFDKLYEKMNVIIPKKDVINLSASSYDTHLINKIKIYLGFPSEESEEINSVQNITYGLNENDFILIHYSIFERMFKKDEINDKLEDIAKRGINVIVTSGRGTPENLTIKARFVNLSSVINSFVDIRSKYLINYLLNSSRKSNKI